MRRFYKILFFAFFAACLFLSLNKTADAAEYTFSAVSASPTANRFTCGAGELNGFTAYISNQSFDSTSGTFTYKVNVAWGRCLPNGDDPTSRAYAIFANSSLCPNSGSYGESGLAYDCVKYIGSPAYSRPSDLNCPAGANSACTTSAFKAAIIEQQYPDWLSSTTNRTYTQTYTIPYWGTVKERDRSYSVPTDRMCQYYKIQFPDWVAVDRNNCLDMSVSVNWTKNYYQGIVQTNKQLLDYSLTSDPTVNNARITLSHSGQGCNSWSETSTAQSWPKALWVNPCDSSVSTQGDYNNSIEVPTGYKVNRVQLSGGDTSGTAISCTSEGITVVCSLAGVRVVNGTYTYVDWFLEKIPVSIPHYPWLQTTGGNVVANGKITGNAASNTLPGARLTTNTDKEVEFLIISKAGYGGPFCSRKNYILTNPSATTGDCGNGLGYSALNVYSLANGADDKVVAGVKDAYNALPDGCKGTTTTGAGLTSNGVLLPLLNKSAQECPNGVIIKYTNNASPTLPSIAILKGRVTILVEGDLNIGQNVGYGTTGYSNPRDVPNLAIVVKGNVKVLAAASRVDASIYASGFISTCNTASNVPIVFCGYPLTINGFLSAQSGFTFGRAYINNPTGQAVPLGNPPAEIINLTLQSVVYPPPGIDYSSVFKGDSSVKIDSSEYQPRF